MKGICCGCQGSVELVSAQRRELSLVDYTDDQISDECRWLGESVDYLVIEHEFCGERCDGSGQVPQVVLKSL